MAVINLPTMEQFDKMNDYLSIIAGVGHVKLLNAYEIQRAIRNGTIQNIVSEGDFFTVGRGGTDWLFSKKHSITMCPQDQDMRNP